MPRIAYLSLLVGMLAGPAVEAERARFEGTWRFESLQVEGMTIPPASLAESRLILKGNRFTMVTAEGEQAGTYVCDPSANPKTLDIAFTEGPEKGKVSRGIYKLEGDTYTLCVGLAGRDRPTAFASTPGSGNALEVLKRVPR